MTARQAIDAGIRLVREAQWNPFCYLELPEKLADGTTGPWAYLHDPISVAVMRRNGETVEFPQAVMFTIWDKDSVDNLQEFTGDRVTPEDVEAGRHIKSVPLGVK